MVYCILLVCFEGYYLIGGFLYLNIFFVVEAFFEKNLFEMADENFLVFEFWDLNLNFLF